MAFVGIVVLTFWLVGFALILIALHQIHKSQVANDNRASLRHFAIMEKLDVQPPLADEKPQAVQVTIKPTAKTMTAWMDFEASQKAALDEFKEN